MNKVEFRGSRILIWFSKLFGQYDGFVPGPIRKAPGITMENFMQIYADIDMLLSLMIGEVSCFVSFTQVEQVVKHALCL